MLTRTKNVVLWRAIAEDISEQIETGRLSPGDRLPTENEFADRYGVNRHTVRRALAELQARSKIEVTQGRGSFVRRPLIAYRIRRASRIDEVVRLQRAAPGGRDLAYWVEGADPETAAALGVEPGSEVVAIEKKGMANDQPVCLSQHCLPIAEGRLGPAFMAAYAKGASIDEALEACGVRRVRRQSTTVRARLATPREMAALDLPRHAPLLVAESVIVDESGTPIEYNLARFASDRVEISFDTSDACC